MVLFDRLRACLCTTPWPAQATHSPAWLGASAALCRMPVRPRCRAPPPPCAASPRAHAAGHRCCRPTLRARARARASSPRGRLAGPKVFHAARGPKARPEHAYFGPAQKGTRPGEARPGRPGEARRACLGRPPGTALKHGPARWYVYGPLWACDLLIKKKKKKHTHTTQPAATAISAQQN